MSSPKSPEHTEKTKKYDRQLRLWGEHGQSLLEEANICLINATATGTEVLKSLVLPGCGRFTIIDGKTITAEDVGSNFFLDEDSIGKSRAQVATQLLLEMNSDVTGDYVDESAEHILRDNPNFFANFTIIIAVAVPERVLLKLSSLLWSLNIPLVVCKTCGLLGSIRIQANEHIVRQSHSDSTIQDLRLDKPFPELVAFMDSQIMSEMDKKDHSHTPYIVILYKCLQEWKKSHNDLPITFKEKQEFKQLINRGIMLKESGDQDDEENFQEAVKAVNTALSPSKIPPNLIDIFNSSSCLNLNRESKPFWILCKALNDFVYSEGRNLLPVRGTLPDMVSDTKRYIALQNIYRERAAKDAQAVYMTAQQLLNDVGSHEGLSEIDVKMFCRYCHELKVIYGRSLNQEVDPTTANVPCMIRELENPDSQMVYYLLLRGVDKFYSDNGYYPGEYNHQVESDIIRLKSCVYKILSELGLPPLSKDDSIQELCRYGGAELASVAAFIGGCCAQEVIKLITSQYVPIDNTFIYNAITSTSSVFRL